MNERRVIGTLGDLAAVPGMPSEPTLRKMIRENPDFPLISQGKNGVAYEIDVEAAVAWIKARAEEERAAARARSEEVRQFALDLLGADAASDQVNAGLSPSERQALLQEELLAIKLAERRGELIRKASVEDAVAAVLTLFRDRGRTFSTRLAKRMDLPRETIAAIDALVDQDLRMIADEMERICEVQPGHVDAANGADPAV